MKPQLLLLSLSATLCQDQYTEEFTQLWNNLGRHPLPTLGLELLSHWSRAPSIYPELIRVFTYWLHLLWKSTPLGACVLRFVGLVHQWAFLFLHLYSPQRLRSCWVGHVASLVLGSPRPSCHTAVCAASEAAGCPRTDSPAPQHRSLGSPPQPQPKHVGMKPAVPISSVTLWQMWRRTCAGGCQAACGPAEPCLLLPRGGTLVLGATLWYPAARIHETHQNAIISGAFVKCGWAWLTD